MKYINGIIITESFYQVINTELESLGIKSEEEEKLMKVSFFYDQLVHYWEEENDCTGISLTNGNKLIVPYTFDDFHSFILEVSDANTN